MFHFHQHTKALEPHQDLGVNNKICHYEFIFDMYQQDDRKSTGAQTLFHQH
jgi:hypothetical protein